MKATLLTFLFIISFFASFSQVNLNSGLVAYYPFNGNANDESGNGNNTIFNNATLTADQSGNANSAYYFNGVDNYIQIPNAPGLNPANQISISVIVKPMGFYYGPCHGNRIIMKGDADYLTGNYTLTYDDNLFTSGQNCFTNLPDTLHESFYAIATTELLNDTPFVQKDVWHSLVYTCDGSRAKLYVDCKLIFDNTVSGVTFSNQYDLFFGKMNHPQFPYWFNGVMDEVRIYNRALNVQEVTALCAEAGPLPVVLTKFETDVFNKQVNLRWNLEVEDGVQKYVIERSLTGHADFIEIGSVIANNNHVYSFTDNTAGTNKNYYYRLVIIEDNGTVNYSGIKTAKIIEKNKFMVVYPNPSKGNILVRLNGYTGIAKFTVVNSIGQVILHRNETIINNRPIKLKLNTQSKGIYWLRVQTDVEKTIERIAIL